MDADGSGAIGSDELSSAFKVRSAITPSSCLDILILLALNLCPLKLLSLTVVDQGSASFNNSELHANFVWFSCWVSRQAIQQLTR